MLRALRCLAGSSFSLMTFSFVYWWHRLADKPAGASKNAIVFQSLSTLTPPCATPMIYSRFITFQYHRPAFWEDWIQLSEV
jgi:hypothetical protein